MNDREAAGGIGFSGALALLFIGLKLGGIIDWSWLWVLSPVWIPLGAALVIGVVLLLIYLGLSWHEERDKARRRRAREDQPAPHEHGPAFRWRDRG